MRRLGTRLTLAASGALLALIGGALMLKPKLFLTLSEAFVEHDPNLMSEITAPTGLLILTGTLMLIGSLRLRFANLGLLCGAVVYGSYGLSRLVSLYLHGTPSDQLVVVGHFELGAAAVLMALLARDQLMEREHFDPSIEHTTS